MSLLRSILLWVCSLVVITAGIPAGFAWCLRDDGSLWLEMTGPGGRCIDFGGDSSAPVSGLICSPQVVGCSPDCVDHAGGGRSRVAVGNNGRADHASRRGIASTVFAFRLPGPCRFRLLWVGCLSGPGSLDHVRRHVSSRHDCPSHLNPGRLLSSCLGGPSPWFPGRTITVNCPQSPMHLLPVFAALLLPVLILWDFGPRPRTSSNRPRRVLPFRPRPVKKNLAGSSPSRTCLRPHCPGTPSLRRLAGASGRVTLRWCRRRVRPNPDLSISNENLVGSGYFGNREQYQNTLQLSRSSNSGASANFGPRPRSGCGIARRLSTRRSGLRYSAARPSISSRSWAIKWRSRSHARRRARPRSCSAR